MDDKPTSAPKQSKGVKKLWLKFKASMKSNQDKPSTSTAVPTTSKPTTATTSTSPAKNPGTDPAPTQADPPTIAQPKSKEVVQETKPEMQPLMASEVIQVDDDNEDLDEKIQIPQSIAMTTDKEANALRYQRAQDIFKKYNLEIDPADWQQADQSGVPRVEKKTRMRVRYICHECKQTFGREKKCSNCSHMRCASCARYPAKRTGDKGKQRQPRDTASLDPAVPTTGACHECKTAFDIGAAQCENCNHDICSRCLKETVMASPATAPPSAQPVSVAAAS